MEQVIWFVVGVALLALALLVARGGGPDDRPPSGIEGGPSWPS